MRNITLLTGTMLFLPMTVMAQSINCTPSPDCASLGYTESSCPDGAGVKCPWGNTWFCTEEKCDTSYQYTCSGTGYAGGSGETCNGKYKSCTCADGYEWKDGACQKKPAEQAEWGKCNGYAKNCNIGDFIFSDRTCSSQKISGKTPIAVVVYKSDDSNCGQAMALKSIGSYIWGPTYDDILTLTNFDSTESISYDLSSCVNTRKIIAEGDKNIYPAAWAAHEYKTEGTEAEDWCLPAAGVWMSIENNISLINNRFVQAQGTQIGDTTYWSSSEYLTMGAWNWTSASLWLGGKNYRKDNLFMVRPVLEF